MPKSQTGVDKLGMIGAGAMGGGMILLMAEYGMDVHFYDPSGENKHKVMDKAKSLGLEKQLQAHDDYKSLCNALEHPEQSKYFMFSIPHGSVGDKTMEELEPYLKKGDVILDASNEHWENTERRQQKADPKGIHYIGMGVSGGYQAARHGPSISPGGSAEGLKKVMPFLKVVAARDNKGRSCVAPVGPAGSGHYVKMVHNGIEQAMMSVLCEVWGIMNKGMGMKYEEIADAWESWLKTSKLNDNFLINIGVDINRRKDDKGEFVLGTIRDKVVQDVDESEGTGTWTLEELSRLHAPGPSIAAAHLFRCASADAARRERISKAWGGAIKPSQVDVGSSKDDFLQHLRDVTYACFIMCFCQGFDLIRKKSDESEWDLDMAKILPIWRGGCIIQSDGIIDLFQTVFDRADYTDSALLTAPEVADELKKCWPSMKKVVSRCVESDQIIPSISQSLEWYKYNSEPMDLPTQFMEAELDYFGQHNYDLRSEAAGKPKTGPHHYEWKPAVGIKEAPWPKVSG